MAEDAKDQTDGDLSEEDEEGEEGKGGLNVKKLLIILIPLLLIGGGGAGAYFTGMLDSMLGVEKPCSDVTEEDDPERFKVCEEELATEEAKKKAAPGAFIEVPPITVNLNSSARRPPFLKIIVKIEVDDEEGVAEMEKIMPRINDQFQTYLRELRPEDLKGSSGIYRLRNELLARVRVAAPDINIREVLFQEIIIQ